MSANRRIMRQLLAGVVAILACDAGKPVVPMDAGVLPTAALYSDQAASAEATIVDLGRLPGSVAMQARAVNNLGQVVGRAQFRSDGGEIVAKPWYWSRSSGMIAMALQPSMVGGEAWDINDAGLVVGWAELDDGLAVPVVWASVIESPRVLPLLPGYSEGTATAVNEHGVVVGRSGLGVDRVPVRWLDGATSVEEFQPDLPGGWARAVNEQGNIAGYSIPFPADAFYWSQGTLTVIGTFGGLLAYAQDMNDHDQVVGPTFSATYGWRGFAWDAATGDVTMLDFNAYAINNVGEIVGVMVSEPLPVLWSPTDGMQLLPMLVDATEGGIAVAYDINDGGQVAGYAYAPDGNFHAVLWERTLSAVIDVRRVVNVRGANGVIPVAVFSTSVTGGDQGDFDASAIEVATVMFGPGNAAPTHDGHFADLDGDGDIDALFHFRVGASGITCGDSEAGLTGQLQGGQRFRGTDEIRVTGC